MCLIWAYRYWQDDPLWYVLNDSTLAKWPSIWVRWRLTSAERSSLWAGMTLHTNWMTICIGLITPWSNDPLYYGFLENGFFKFQLNSQIQQLGQHLGGFLFIFIATWSFVNYSLHHIIVMKMCSLTNFKEWSKMLKLLNNSRKTFMKWFFLGWMTLNKLNNPQHWLNDALYGLNDPMGEIILFIGWKTLYIHWTTLRLAKWPSLWAEWPCKWARWPTLFVGQAILYCWMILETEWPLCIATQSVFNSPILIVLASRGHWYQFLGMAIKFLSLLNI